MTTCTLTILQGKMAVVLVLLMCLFAGTDARSRFPRLHLRAPPLSLDAKPPAEQWFDQKLDHIGNAPGTWKQRYFVNDSYWSSANGPVFLMLGGEGPANPAWIYADTDIMKNARKYKALVVSLEHRYYGASHPTPDLSNKNLVYLSSRQALADVGTLKSVITTQYKLTDKNRWISFGGSYSGALSAWLRLKYPDLIDGAVATSAPVLAKFNFYEYLEVVERSLGSSEAGIACVHAIKAATTLLDTLLQNKSNWKKVEALFNISPPLADILDISQVAQNFGGNFMGVVQYNMDNTAFEGRPNNITIDDLCSVMANESLGPPLHRYASVNKYMLGDDTINCSFADMIQEMSRVDWNSSAAEGGRQWYYQTCTEFGYYQTTDSAHQPFGDLISLASFTEVCRLAFNVTSAQTFQAVKSTNAYYGGRSINATNIVFPNGSIDPWHALSITNDIGPTLNAVFINGTAHCANMYPARDSDLPSLAKAREDITHSIGTWLNAL